MQTVRGMRDLLPEIARKKQFIIDECRKAFEGFGFEPLETPVVEDFELLAKKGSGGEAIKEEIYYFKDKSERELGLRFDLTVPLARVVATNPQLAKPFKRYAVGNVYRYDRPGASRYREFTQADFDIIGAKGILAELECMCVFADAMGKLGADFYIKINDKRLLEEIALGSEVNKEQLKECLRSLDKLDKIGKTEVRKELEGKGIAIGILEALEKNFSDYSSFESAKDLNELLILLEENGIREKVKVDLSLARGLEYYTGIVFELCSGKGPSIGGGGRYDELIGLYGGAKCPAVGGSFGIDRILDLLGEALPSEPSARLFVAGIGNAQKEALKAAREARENGINTETDLMQRSIGKNMEYASKKRIPFVVIIGENEVKARKARVKDMESGMETEIPLKGFGKALKGIIK